KDVVQAAHQARHLPALDELRYRLDKHIARIEKNLRSGDEVGIISFLRADVERQFDTLQEFGVAVRERVAAYRAAVDPKLGTVYARRRLFEESVTRIAEAISAYLDLEEQAAQAMYPHYFEKQKTDGVDYQIYVGASLVEDGRFDPLYLKSLRLWQLMVTCGVALRTHQLRDRLAVPLEATPLVLVQHLGYLTGEVEDVELEELQGVHGLRALRVTVDLKNPRIERAASARDLTMAAPVRAAL